MVCYRDVVGASKDTDEGRESDAYVFFVLWFILFILYKLGYLSWFSFRFKISLGIRYKGDGRREGRRNIPAPTSRTLWPLTLHLIACLYPL